MSEPIVTSQTRYFFPQIIKVLETRKITIEEFAEEQKQHFIDLYYRWIKEYSKELQDVKKISSQNGRQDRHGILLYEAAKRRRSRS